MIIKELIDNYQNYGYDYADATSKVCQDILLLKIANSKFSRNITIKGGVVMHNISNDIRRATRDLDLDFIRYSLDDNSIRNFINILSKNDDKMRENNILDILKRLEGIFNSKKYRNSLANPKVNWLDISIDEAIESILNYLEDLQSVSV